MIVLSSWYADRCDGYSECIQVVSEPVLLLPTIAARTEYGAFCAVEARTASLTDVIRRPFGGICGA